MSTVESIVLWLCFAMLAWISFSLIGIYDVIRKILTNQIEMKARLETIQGNVWDASDMNRRSIDGLKDRLFGGDD
jgi:hypothetical protein